MQFFRIKRKKQKVSGIQAVLTRCASATNYTLKSTKLLSDHNAPRPHLKQLLRVFPLLPTHWQIVFKAVCLIHKCLYRAGQRCLSEVVPAAPWATSHSPGYCLPHLLFSPLLLMPRARWRGRKWSQGTKEGAEKRAGIKGIVKTGRGWNYYYY